MKALMEVCQNWGAEECHPDISKWSAIEESEYHEGIQLHPGRENVDEICRNCEALSFKECPDCGSKDIVKMAGLNPKKVKKIVGSVYTCKNCDFSITQAGLI